MGFRVRGRIKVCKGVYINVGKKGITSVSAKVGGTTINKNRKGRVKATTKVCRGVSYETTLKKGKQTTNRRTTTTTRKPTKKELEQIRIREEQERLRQEQERERIRAEQKALELERSANSLINVTTSLQNNFTKYDEMIFKIEEQITLFETIDETDMSNKNKKRLIKQNIKLCNRLIILMNHIDIQVKEYIRLCHAVGVDNQADFTDWHNKKVWVRERVCEFRKGLRHVLFIHRIKLITLPFILIAIVLSFPFILIKELFKKDK